MAAISEGRDRRGRFQTGGRGGMSGKRHSKATKEKIKRALNSDMVNQKLREAHRGNRAYNYKGDKVSYFGLHAWVKRWRGSPFGCENCGTQAARRYEWANVSGEYLRSLDDWVSLCKSCHCLVDGVGRKVWEIRRTREYKKHTPWNKGKRFVNEKKCFICNKGFYPRKPTRKCCSNKCGATMREQKKRLCKTSP